MIKYYFNNNFAEILEKFGSVKILGDRKRIFCTISNLEDIKINSLIYINDKNYLKTAIDSPASVIIIPLSLETIALNFLEKNLQKTFVVSQNPKLLFAYASTIFKKRTLKYGIDRNTIIKSKINGKEVEIQPFVVIGENVVIEKDVIIESFVNIGNNCKIGKGTVIFSGVKIYDNCEIGNDCIIHSNTVIGADGFGYVFDGNNYQKIEHIGKVIIEDDVEIGANCCIDRATIGETRIKKGTKIDNLVQIAHNVTVGENSVICAQVGIAGGAQIGNHVTFAGQVGVSDHAIVEDNVVAGAQAGLATKKYEKNKFILGTPAMDALKFKKSTVLFSQLPELAKQIYNIQNALNEIRKNLIDKG